MIDMIAVLPTSGSLLRGEGVVRRHLSLVRARSNWEGDAVFFVDRRDIVVRPTFGFALRQ